MIDELDHAYQLLHRLGPEFGGNHSSHASMVAEILVRRHQEQALRPWLHWYIARLGEIPSRRERIGTDEWRSALGEPQRLGDWLAFFAEQQTELGWRDLLRQWWPRLLPGVAAAATHGVIRTGHAVVALLATEASGDAAGGARPRRDELAVALACWAARWATLPGRADRRTGSLSPAAAFAALPIVPDQTTGVWDRFRQLADLPAE